MHFLIAILERRNSAGRAVYKSLSDIWSGSEENKFVLLDYLDQLRKDPGLLTSDTILPELYDELAPARDDAPFIVNLLSAVYSVWDCRRSGFQGYFKDLSGAGLPFYSDSSDEREPNATEKEEPPEKSEKNETAYSRESTKIPRKGFLEVTELTDINYTSNLLRLRPGHMNVVLIVSGSTKASLLQRFAQEVYTFTGSGSLHFSFLNLDKHREWLEYLLEFAQDAASIAYQYDEHFLDRDYTGYVLALNGHKKYFCLFKAQSSIHEDQTIGPAEEFDSTTLGVGLRKISSGSGPGLIKRKLNKLSLWMERLMEGSLQRFYIPSWPALAEQFS